MKRDSVRICEQFLYSKGKYLSDLGYKTDDGKVEYTAERSIVFYH